MGEGREATKKVSEGSRMWGKEVRDSYISWQEIPGV